MTPVFSRHRDIWAHREPLTLVRTADAVLLRPLPPIDQLAADYLMGRLTRNQYRGLISAAETVLALLSPDSLPEEVAG